MDRQEVIQQKLEHWCAASIRAISGRPKVRFRGRRLLDSSGEIRFSAPHLRLDIQSEYAARHSSELRGVADSIALRLLHSEYEKHSAKTPVAIVEQLIFEILEQLRCEACAPVTMPGIISNLRRRFLFWANGVASSKLVENDLGLLVFTIYLVAWSRIQRQAIPEQLEEVVEATRWGFSAELKFHLRACAKNIGSQTQFAEHALAVSKEIQKMVDGSAASNDLEVDQNETAINLAKELNLLNSSFSEIETDVAGNVSVNEGVANNSRGPGFFEQSNYKIFNPVYDKTMHALEGIRIAKLQQWRHQIDDALKHQSVNKPRAARSLQEQLFVVKSRVWLSGQEEGYLDSAKLARVITNVGDQKVFKREHDTLGSDCVISILIDNSGSMNHHNTAIASMVDTLGHVIDIAGCRSEILGFTTTEWNGGKVLREWKKAGEPSHPGRLNSLNHIIYKSADKPWRRTKLALAPLLKNDRFKEGIDGEAVEWAITRLSIYSEQIKILLVVSDGSPMDSATNAANAQDYLDRHLIEVVQNAEARRDVAICGLGVGLDLSRYYQANLELDIAQNLDQKTLLNIIGLMTEAVMGSVGKNSQKSKRK